MTPSLPALKRDFLELRLQQTLVQLFGESDALMTTGIRALLEWVDLPGGAFLFRQGDACDGLYLLAAGRLKVQCTTPSGDVQERGDILPGEMVGEMGLLTGDPRSADVQAARDCVLARLPKVSFDHLVERYPKAWMNISKTVIERLRRQDTPPSRQRIKNLCLLPISDKVDAAAFAAQLCKALSIHGRILFLDGHSFHAFAQGEGIEHIGRGNRQTYRQLTAWLEEQEAVHRYVVYLPDPEPNSWTRRCLRQADEILLLADPTADPGLHPLERRYLHGNTPLSIAGQTLLLLQPNAEHTPQGTLPWLEQRQLHFHHHIRHRHEGDVARLARFLSGTAVGLVLSGGAAKGMAHIGVFRALEEAGIPIDMVGGTSIGAIMGALVARGWSGETIRARCKEVFRKNPTSDFNLVPRVAIFKGKKLDQLLKENFNGQQIEDLRLNFFSVSCNLTKNRPHIHRRGNLTEALRAGISIPGVFPPAELGNDLYVDGGVFNNMPVDIMRDLGVGAIIAVDLQVYRNEEREEMDAYRKRKLPNLFFVVMESAMLSGRYHAQSFKSEVALYFNPPLKGFSLIDWHKFDAIEEIGYRHAKEVLGNKGRLGQGVAPT